MTVATLCSLNLKKFIEVLTPTYLWKKCQLNYNSHMMNLWKEKTIGKLQKDRNGEVSCPWHMVELVYHFSYVIHLRPSSSLHLERKLITFICFKWPTFLPCRAFDLTTWIVFPNTTADLLFLSFQKFHGMMMPEA